MSSSIYVYDDILVIDGEFSLHINFDTHRWYLGNKPVIIESKIGIMPSGWFRGLLYRTLNQVMITYEN